MLAAIIGFLVGWFGSWSQIALFLIGVLCFYALTQLPAWFVNRYIAPRGYPENFDD